MKKFVKKCRPAHVSGDTEPNAEELVEIEKRVAEIELKTPKEAEEIREYSGRDLYLKDVVRYPLLPHKEMLAIAKKVKEEKCPQATEMLICHNLRFVLSVARDFANRGLSQMDLVQEGNVGLMKAVERFDYRSGNKFTTYAVWWIKQAMKRALDNTKSHIRMPIHMHSSIGKYRQIEKMLWQELGRNPKLEEIKAKMGLSEKRFRMMRLAQEIQVHSLNTPVSLNGEGDESEIGNLIMSVGTADPAMILSIKEQREEAIASLRFFFATLDTLDISKRDKESLLVYYGLNVDGSNADKKERVTLENLGKRHDVTRERIRQINAMTIADLRRAGVSVDKHSIRHIIDRIHAFDKLVGEETDVQSVIQNPGKPIPGTWTDYEMEGSVSSKEKPETQELSVRIDIKKVRLMLEAVAAEYQIPSELLQLKGREPQRTEARSMAAYLMHADLGIPYSHVWKAINGKHHTRAKLDHDTMKRRLGRKGNSNLVAQIARIRKSYLDSLKATKLASAASK